MRSSKSVIDVDIAQGGQLGRKGGVIIRFFIIIAQVFKEKHFTRIQQLGRRQGGGADAVVNKGYRLLKQGLQCPCTGFEG